ncbi:helix-turn-helix domain-containing protein [Noviherbaspirillum cavernae]|uniref:Helix-turn-helix domain-containing protein n=1 Tax=Noviherbaspirillum cavernae TaxID=2320862 RepID=A0A418X2J8_9BURK|nr:helix-turn-helix domain-containing protein [Noviherbaspirillum cavernae]RJG06679.1 helix-turn-helix domain-containing protein [Noviherbaspirillum cavernae]
MPQVQGVPIYKLYGEDEQWLMPEMMHCETIAARSKLHDWQIKPHQHHGLFQLLYLRDGTARIRLDEREENMGAGEVLAVPQMCIHGFHFAHNAGGHVVTVAYPLLEKISRQLGDRVAALGMPRMHRLDGDEESEQVRLAFSLIDSEYKRNAPYRNLLIESLLGTILIWMLRRLPAVHADQPRTTGKGDRHFAAFCQLVEEGYARHHPVAGYAEKIGITAAHLNVLCRNAANQSALDIIHERVLLEAKRNLVYTAMTISEVSDALGFSDPAYFTRFFKRQTGMSPKDFRAQAKTLFEQGT